MKMAENKIDYFNTERFNKEIGSIISAVTYTFVGDYSKSYETWKRALNIIRCFREEIAARDVRAVADIGCSNGLYIFILNSVAGIKKGTHFHGIDIDAVEICYAEEAKKRLGLDNIYFSVGNAEDTKLPEKHFDVVLLNEVIEHTVDPCACLKEVARILKPGGAAIITTPNKDNIFHKLSRIFRPRRKGEDGIRSFDMTGKRPGPYSDHVAVKGFGEWRRIIKESGLKIELIKGGSFLQGGPCYNAHPVIFGISIILDSVLGNVNFLAGKTENVTFKLRRISS